MGQLNRQVERLFVDRLEVTDKLKNERKSYSINGCVFERECHVLSETQTLPFVVNEYDCGTLCNSIVLAFTTLYPPNMILKYAKIRRSLLKISFRVWSHLRVYNNSCNNPFYITREWIELALWIRFVTGAVPVENFIHPAARMNHKQSRNAL